MARKKLARVTPGTWDKGGRWSKGMVTADHLPEILKDRVSEDMLFSNRKGVKAYSIPCSIDIETSSFMDGADRRACMYIWMMGINGAVIYGRTWAEYFDALETIRRELQLDANKRLIFYVHNLAYEFQWLCHWEDWDSVFAIDSRKPAYATSNGIEYRCSYILTGYSLANWGKNLHTYHEEKAVGDLDYKLVRHPETPLTPTEMYYCEQDIRVVMAGIEEKLEAENGNIFSLPLTKTGYVRRECRNACYRSTDRKEASKKYRNYRRLMESLTLTPELYRQLRRAFAGGFTHAAACTSGKLLTSVGSYDLTSSYPAVMLYERFPMSMPVELNISDISEMERLMGLYCCLFDVEFRGLRPKVHIDHPLSYSKCWKSEGVVSDNGRVVSAELAVTTITEQDYFTFKDFYEWDSIRVAHFKVFRRDYLPKDLAMAILHFYQNKTKLKGVKGEELNYSLSKENANSCYGMMVTDPLRDENEFMNGEWLDPTEPDIEEGLEKYNKSKSRFLWYPWGVWVTAYARRRLFQGILDCGDDYHYADTDSLKISHSDVHKAFIEESNRIVDRKIALAAKHYGIDPSEYSPKTIKGVEKTIGYWDFEGIYKQFKTLGAKRYMIEDEDGYNITVSGLNKKVAMPYIEQKAREAGVSPFDLFTDQLYIPAGFTGKSAHHYEDNETSGVVTDYLGVPYNYHEMSSIHLEEEEYRLSIASAYADYILEVQTIEE